MSMIHYCRGAHIETLQTSAKLSPEEVFRTMESGCEVAYESQSWVIVLVSLIPFGM